MRHTRAAISLLAISWIVLLVTAPTAALGVPTSGVVYAVSSFICHQRPERSFHIAGAQLPVCARCFGLYLGGAISVLAILKGCATNSVLWRSPSPFGVAQGAPSDSRGARLRSTIAIAAIPTAVTWGAEVAGLWSPSNITRFAAALPLGAAVALTVNYLECARPPRNGSRLPPTPI